VIEKPKLIQYKSRIFQTSGSHRGDYEVVFWTEMPCVVLRQPNVSELQVLSELNGITGQKYYHHGQFYISKPLRGERDGVK
jgi:hypothetical protein